MKQDTNLNTTTTALQETQVTQVTQAATDQNAAHNSTQNTQQDNGLTKGMKWYQVFTTGFPMLMQGLCLLVVFAFLATVMWWVWGGTIPPSDVYELAKLYFTK
ncbi:hypothetical protein [Cytobacillus sp. BC1816]|uniref:hypothetical protein n=1 Tax=Cytobacillus sp. BC1816 TaxID=3440154 RepID=UPI003F516BF6